MKPSPSDIPAGLFRAPRSTVKAQQDAKGRVLLYRVPKIPCGAKTRKGTPCQAAQLVNGRCKFHGGLSTGPMTPDGKARVAEGARRRWAAFRVEKAAKMALEATG